MRPDAYCPEALHCLGKVGIHRVTDRKTLECSMQNCPVVDQVLQARLDGDSEKLASLPSKIENNGQTI